jgi:hypothetical protein
VGEVLSVLSLPGSGFLGKLGDKYFERKQKEAAEILIEEVAKGSPEPINFTESDADPLIEIIYRFSRATFDSVSISKFGSRNIGLSHAAGSLYGPLSAAWQAPILFIVTLSPHKCWRNRTQAMLN